MAGWLSQIFVQKDSAFMISVYRRTHFVRRRKKTRKQVFVGTSL